MLSNVSAYNGEPRSLTTSEGNTVGSLTETQRSILIGCLLGDGTMRCRANALLEINHGIRQRTYVDWKFQQLRNLVRTPPKLRLGNGGRIAYRFTTRSLPELTPLYRLFYTEGRKIVPDDLPLTPLSLAVWFMDDGSKSYRALYLNTQQFDLGNQQRLIDLLDVRWKVTASLNRDKKYFRLRIAVGSVARFREVTEPFVLPQFAYKFP